MTPANIFVLGLDELNLSALQRLPGAEEYRFHPLLSVEELLRQEEVRLPELLARAEQQLESFEGSVDAVIGYWDFPVSSMMPMLGRRFGLHGPDLDAVVRCEHKYWSRLEQAKAIDDLPRFDVLQPEEQEELPAGLSYPVWVKPVKSVSSELAYRVEDDEQLADALTEIRDGIGRFADPFEFVLDHVELPPEVAEIGAHACLVEEAATGHQVTVEGFSHRGDVHVYGIVDSHHYPGTSSFLRYQYPSRLPEHVAARLADDSRKVIRQIGFDAGTFNIEYFWDPDRDRVDLLEVNPRHSQSHALLFEHVDGVPNHHCMVRLALGRDPDLPKRQGRYQVAAKWFLRRFEDGVVRRTPSAEEVRAVEERAPGATVEVVARQGTRLSDTHGQDSYSYELARVHVGAQDEHELVAKYERCVEALPFAIDEVDQVER